jgi:glycerophosphoryl diester phosphodiesterase
MSWSSSGSRRRDRALSRRCVAAGLVAVGLTGVLGAGVGAEGTRAPGPCIVAHRGGALLWAENSLTAFREAIALGADLLELDVHLTRDGEVVVIHDPTLERTTTGRGAVRNMTWAELRGLTLRGTAEPIPRLRDVLELAAPSAAGLLVEIKVGVDRVAYPGIEEKVLALLSDAGVLDRTTVMAFDWTILARLRAQSARVRLTGLLSERGAALRGSARAAVAQLHALGASDLGIEHTLLTADLVAAARAAGLTIGVWTVNEPADLSRALAAGVDYVTTDRPDLALSLRRLVPGR